MLGQRRRRWANIETALGKFPVFAVIYIWILLYVAFWTMMAISRQEEARNRDYALLLFRMTSTVLYSAQYVIGSTVHSMPLNSFGALYMHNLDDDYQSRPGFEPGTPRLQASVDTNKPSGPAVSSNDDLKQHRIMHYWSFNSHIVCLQNVPVSHDGSHTFVSRSVFRFQRNIMFLSRPLINTIQ